MDRADTSELENMRGNPTVDFLEKLAAVLDLPLYEFLRLPEPGAKKPRALSSGKT